FIDDIDRVYGGADAAEKFVIGGVVFTRKEHWRTQQRYGLHHRHGRRFGPGLRIGFVMQISTFTHCGNSYLLCRAPPFLCCSESRESTVRELALKHRNQVVASRPRRAAAR